MSSDETDRPGVDAPARDQTDAETGAPAELQHRLEAALVDLLDRRPTGSVCPSEAARAVGSADWRPLMEPVRVIARRLVADGQAEITQHGEVVDPATAVGPIRVRRPRPPG